MQLFVYHRSFKSDVDFRMRDNVYLMISDNLDQNLTKREAKCRRNVLLSCTERSENYVLVTEVPSEKML